MKKKRLQFFIFPLIILGVFWLILQVSFTSTNKPPLPPQYPDSYMGNVVAVQMDVTGHPESRYFSPTMVHFKKDNASDLTKPDMYVYSVDQPAWHITADQGRAEQGLQLVHLWGHVHAHQPAGKTSPPMTILTTQATVYPHTKIIISHAPVTLIQPGTKVHSIGARANMRKGEVDLFSNANATYNQKLANQGQGKKQHESKSTTR
tara:strand:+ start:30856 stop:31470 length:615 start_codon:yes stop_codon:yes gene_type:complete